MNTVPGMTTRFKFTPTITTDEMRVKMNNPNFNYVLMCNKICGSSHYKMKLMVVVLDKAAYKAWYKNVSTTKKFKDVYPVGKPKAAEPVAGADATGMDTTAVTVK